MTNNDGYNPKSCLVGPPNGFRMDLAKVTMPSDEIRTVGMFGWVLVGPLIKLS